MIVPRTSLIVKCVRHVLPYQHSETVTMPVPACRLNLHMLSDHVESHILCHLDVKEKGLIGRSGIKSVRPPSLVKCTELEYRLVVEVNAIESLVILSV